MKKGDIIRHVALLGEPYDHGEAKDARVTWVINGEVAAQSLSDPTGHHIFQEGDKDWVVIQESAPSFQSQVASMSDEELKAAVDAMRGGRAVAPVEVKEKKVRAPKLSTEEAGLLALMSQLTPEEQQKLKVKLGI